MLPGTVDEPGSEVIVNGRLSLGKSWRSMCHWQPLLKRRIRRSGFHEDCGSSVVRVPWGRAGEARCNSIGHRKDPLGKVFSYLLELWITTPRPLFIQSLHALR